MGFMDLHTINKAYMTKLAWKILRDEECLWVKVFKAKYKFNPAVRSFPSHKPTDSPSWKGICNAWPLANQGAT